MSEKDVMLPNICTAFVREAAAEVAESKSLSVEDP
jgi:hypothetical protein